MTHTDEQIQDLVREMYTTAESADWQLTAEDLRSHRARRRVPVPDAKVLALAAAAVVLILVGISVGRATNPHKTSVNASTTTSTSTPTTVTVPTGAVDTTVANAMAIMNADSLKVTVGYVSSTSPAGTVLAVTPSAGTHVVSGSAVTLKVSSGPVAVHAPNVVGLSQAAAATALGRVGLDVGSITVVPSTIFPAGDVVRQDPAADLQVSPGTSVDLSVSSGP
jgi:beta-lactam-binding protein with PASTA domain